MEKLVVVKQRLVAVQKRLAARIRQNAIVIKNQIVQNVQTDHALKKSANEKLR